MQPPRVSILCATYNGAAFLAQAIDSVLAQDFNDYELILVDDGSSDGSRDIAEDYARRHPERVRYFEHPGHSNRGASPSRNLAHAAARGELIALLDCDDVWRSNKLGEQVRIMESDQRLAMVCGTVNYWSAWAGGKDRLVPTGHMLDRPAAPLDTLLSTYPLGTAHAPVPSDVMVRRSALEAQPFAEDFVGPAQIYEDQLFFVKIYLAGPVLFSSRVWTDYRQHPDSCVSVVSRSGLYPEIRRRFLDWFDEHLDDSQLPEKARVKRAIGRARWALDHPNAARLLALPRRLAARVRNIAG